MAEHIERTEKLMLALNAGARAITNTKKYHGTKYVMNAFSSNPKEIEYLDAAELLWNAAEAPPADVVEVAELKEFAKDVIYQFGYHCNYNGRLHLTTGGLSTLESAFAILGWPDPKPFPEGECEWEGCHEYANCGTPTPDGYKRVCGKHYAVIEARKEAEAVARMDGE